MPLFTYKAVNSTGETEEGVREASDEAQLIQTLQSDGYIPIRVARAGSRSAGGSLPACGRRTSRPSGSRT